MRQDDYARMERALRFLAEHYRERPSLEEVAARSNMSKYHFQRLFTRWAGITPDRFRQCLALDHAKSLLDGESSVLDVSLDVGLSGPGRLHDLFVTHEAVTPGEFKRRGEGLRISYGFHPTPFGECLLMRTERGICGLGFTADLSRAEALAAMSAGWERARLAERPRDTEPLVNRIFSGNGGGQEPLHLVLRGTNFQVNVWRALLQIPSGRMASYGALARSLGRPGAGRAVGQALARNPVALLIPCHRVITALGEPGHYRWGARRKRLLLAWEAARTLPEPLSLPA